MAKPFLINEVDSLKTSVTTINTTISNTLGDGTISLPTLNTTVTNLVASKGVANGIAGLDSTGKVPAENLPVSGLSELGNIKLQYNTDTKSLDFIKIV